MHLGSVLILVLEALSCQSRTGVPWELLYAGDLAVMADSLEECIARLNVRKEDMEQGTESQHREDEDHGLRT